MRIDTFRNITFSCVAQCLVVLCLFVACSKSEQPANALSDVPIRIGVEGWAPMSNSRATIFEAADDILNEEIGGGNLTMHAYLCETGSIFIGGSRAWYFNSTWRFYNGQTNDFIEYYWPQNNTVDFFAYMPYKDSGRRKSITVGDYVPGTGLNISCQMQSTTSDGVDATDDLYDHQGQETIFAYTTNQSKADPTVDLKFVHPFAAVKFKLKQAHRNLTIDWIRFDNIYLNGSTTLNTNTVNSEDISWTPSGSAETFAIPVDKTIPDEINYNGEIGVEYLVMPQVFDKGTSVDTDDATITIQYTWDNGLTPSDTTDDTKQFTRTIKTSEITEWEAGKKYTYILDLGDNKEEILFKVIVQPWETIGGDNNIIDVE